MKKSIITKAVLEAHLHFVQKAKEIAKKNYDINCMIETNINLMIERMDDDDNRNQTT